MDPLFENRMIQGMKKGDSTAFEKFVEFYQRDIFNLALRYLGNENDALDVSQEIFIKILKKIDTFKGNSKLSTWVYRITVNYCKDYIKKHSKIKIVSMDKSLEGKDGQYYNEIVDNSKGPDQILDSKLVNEEIDESIKMLDEDQREVIILRYINELTYNEIGEILSIPEGTVKSRLNRGRKKLAEILRKKGTY